MHKKPQQFEKFRPRSEQDSARNFMHQFFWLIFHYINWLLNAIFTKAEKFRECFLFWYQP